MPLYLQKIKEYLDDAMKKIKETTKNMNDMMTSQ